MANSQLVRGRGQGPERFESFRVRSVFHPWLNRMNPKLIAAAWQAAGLPAAVAEHRFAPPRQWRFDFAWPEHLVALEVQGGIWSGGRHVRGAALVREWEKLNAAAERGWVIFYCAPGHECGPALVQQLRTVVGT